MSQIADTITTFTLLAHGLRHGQPLPPLVPLRNRLAKLKMRKIADAQKAGNGEFYEHQTFVPMTWESIQVGLVRRNGTRQRIDVLLLTDRAVGYLRDRVYCTLKRHQIAGSNDRRRSFACR